MPYAAAITGEDHVIKSLTSSFSSEIATILQWNGEWILESSRFEAFEFDNDLYKCALQLVSHIHQVVALYLFLPSEPLSIRGLLSLTDDDRLLRRRLIATVDVNVYNPPEEVFLPTASGSLATDVISRTAIDPSITEALSLVGERGFTSWGQVYDIIEFLGLKNKKMQQTANHYRHLGKPKNISLPKNPPTLIDGILFAAKHLKEWIAERLSGSA